MNERIFICIVTASTDYCLDRFFWATWFLFLFFLIFRLCAGHLVSFWAHVNLPYRIVS